MLIQEATDDGNLVCDSHLFFCGLLTGGVVGKNVSRVGCLALKSVI